MVQQGVVVRVRRRRPRSAATMTALLWTGSRSMMRPGIHAVTPSSSGTPCGPSVQWSAGCEALVGGSGHALREVAVAEAEQVDDHAVGRLDGGPVLAVRAMLKVARGGTAARDASDVAVNPTGEPSGVASVTIATPAACLLKACLNADKASATGARPEPGRSAAPRSRLGILGLRLSSGWPPAGGGRRLGRARRYAWHHDPDHRSPRAAAYSRRPRSPSSRVRTPTSRPRPRRRPTLIDDVRQHGADALLDQAERFDRVRPRCAPRRPGRHRRAVATLDPLVKEALVESIARVTEGQSGAGPCGRHDPPCGGGASSSSAGSLSPAPASTCPGGKAVYPSSVVMNVVPAQVAGVRSIALVSPAQSEFGGAVHPTILGAAGLLGIDEVYAIGGAGAIGALAYGVPSLGLEPVQVITGPATTSWPRPSNSCAVVSGSTRWRVPPRSSSSPIRPPTPILVAVDLISQAEHDEDGGRRPGHRLGRVGGSASCAELERLAPLTMSAERVAVALDGRQSALVAGRRSAVRRRLQQRLRPGTPRDPDR